MDIVCWDDAVNTRFHISPKMDKLLFFDYHFGEFIFADETWNLQPNGASITPKNGVCRNGLCQECLHDALLFKAR